MNIRTSATVLLLLLPLLFLLVLIAACGERAKDEATRGAARQETRRPDANGTQQQEHRTQQQEQCTPATRRPDAPPLEDAVRSGREEVVLLLLSRGARVDPEEKNRRTPLMVASARGDAPIAELLLEHGADPNATYRWSSPSGDTHTMETALLNAAARGHVAVARLLIEAGATVSPGVNRPYCTTPLVAALRGGHRGVVEILLAHGADTSFAQEDFGAPGYRLPICEAVETFVAAAQGGFTDLTRRLLHTAGHPNVGVGYQRSCTPLHMAAQEGHAGIVKMLVEAGGELSIGLEHSGKTPLQLANENGHSEVAALLHAARAAN